MKKLSSCLKKTLVCILAAVILISCMPLSFAAGSSGHDISFTVTPKNGKIYVDVFFENCVGLTAGNFMLNYGSNVTGWRVKDGIDKNGIDDIYKRTRNTIQYDYNKETKQLGYYFEKELWDSATWAEENEGGLPINGEHFNAFVWEFTLNDPSVKTEVSVTAVLTFHGISEQYTKKFVLVDNSCVHSWAVKSTTPATCTADGTTVYSCSKCGAEKSEPIAALGHSYGSFEVYKPAVCNITGEKRAYCIRCSVYKTEVIPALEHQFREETVTPATCKKAGEKRNTCTLCGYYTSEPIPMLPHSFDEGSVITPSTCTEQGRIIYICNNCGTSKTGSLPLAQHAFGDVAVTVPATCIAEGKGKKVCSVCSAEEEVVIPVSETHSFGEDIITKPATCSEKGSRIRVCTVCSFAMKDDIPYAAHTFGEGVEEPSLYDSETMIKKYTCSECGKIVKTAGDPYETFENGLGDVDKDKMIKSADARLALRGSVKLERIIEGTYEFYAADIDSNLLLEASDARTILRISVGLDNILNYDKNHSEHDYSVKKVTAPTCEKEGYTTYSCLCGKSYRAETVPALGHDYAAATCTAPKTCTRCNKTDGSALGHDYAAATCTVPKTCKRCGAASGSALGHSYAAATCTAPKTCTRCKATSGEALGHDYAAATCTEAATCKRCGFSTDKPLGHDYAAATCTAPKTCKRCKATSGSALGHDYTAATCTAPKTCKRCGAASGEALGHNYAAATCTAPKTCTRCKATIGSVLGHSLVGAKCSRCGWIDRDILEYALYEYLSTPDEYYYSNPYIEHFYANEKGEWVGWKGDFDYSLVYNFTTHDLSMEEMGVYYDGSHDFTYYVTLNKILDPDCSVDLNGYILYNLDSLYGDDSYSCDLHYSIDKTKVTRNNEQLHFLHLEKSDNKCPFWTQDFYVTQAEHGVRAALSRLEPIIKSCGLAISDLGFTNW